MILFFFFRQNECQTLPKFVACSIKTDAIKLMHYGGRALTYKSEVMFPWGGNASQYECFQMLLQLISPLQLSISFLASLRSYLCSQSNV